MFATFKLIHFVAVNLKTRFLEEYCNDGNRTHRKTLFNAKLKITTLTCLACIGMRNKICLNMSMQQNRMLSNSKNLVHQRYLRHNLWIISLFQKIDKSGRMADRENEGDKNGLEIEAFVNTRKWCFVSIPGKLVLNRCTMLYIRLYSIKAQNSCRYTK